MATGRAQYKISYYSDKYTFNELIYQPHDSSWRISMRHAKNFSFLCVHKSENANSVLSSKFKFTNEEQKNNFDDAIKKNELQRLNDIAKEIEPFKLSHGYPEINALNHPLRYFLEGCFAVIEKERKHNQAFLVSHGVFKPKANAVQYQTREMDGTINDEDPTQAFLDRLQSSM